MTSFSTGEQGISNDKKWQSPLGCGGKIALAVLFVFLCYLCSPVGHVCWGHKQITHLVKLGR